MSILSLARKAELIRMDRDSTIEYIIKEKKHDAAKQIRGCWEIAAAKLIMIGAQITDHDVTGPETLEKAREFIEFETFTLDEVEAEILELHNDQLEEEQYRLDEEEQDRLEEISHDQLPEATLHALDKARQEVRRVPKTNILSLERKAELIRMLRDGTIEFIIKQNKHDAAERINGETATATMATAKLIMIGAQIIENDISGSEMLTDARGYIEVGIITLDEVEAEILKLHNDQLEEEQYRLDRIEHDQLSEAGQSAAANMAQLEIERENAAETAAKLEAQRERKALRHAEANHGRPLPTTVPEPVQQTPTAITCPKCHSTQVVANKQGFGFVKGLALGVAGALTGGVALGTAGLAAGNIGKDKVELTCLSCGKQWRAGRP